MATLAKRADLATNQAFRPPLTAALVSTALDVMAEDATTAAHDRRTALAYQVLQSPAAYLDRFAWALAAGPFSIADTFARGALSDMPDNDLIFSVNSVWNAMAGVATVANPGDE